MSTELTNTPVITKRGDKTPQGEEKKYVFISYCREDYNQVFEKVIIPLQKEYGLQVYADIAFAESNANWIKQMKTNMIAARAVLVFISSNYIRKYACFLEVMTAIHHNIPIVPIYVNENENARSLKDGEDKKIEMSEKTKCAIINVCDTFSGKDTEIAKKNAFDAYSDIKQSLEDNELTFQELTDAFIPLLTKSGFNDNNIKTGLGALKKTIDTIDSGVFGPVNSGNFKKEETTKSTTENNIPAVEVKTSVPVAPKNQPSKTRVGSLTGDINYTLYDKQYTDNQSNMMLRVFAQVLKRHPEAVGEIFMDPENPVLPCVSRINYTLPENKTPDTPSCFNYGAFFDLHGGFFVGTSMNYFEKLKNISRLLTICGEDFSILCSDAIELPTKVQTKNVPKGSEVYSIYGKEYSGDQTKMMTDILQFIMEKHFDKREELAQLPSIKLSPLNELINEKITSDKQYTYQGVTYSIVTSFGREDKLKQIQKAIRISGEDPEKFVAKGMELIKTGGSRSAKKIDFLNGD